jgi:hypothetical protein
MQQRVLPIQRNPAGKDALLKVGLEVLVLASTKD